MRKWTKSQSDAIAARSGAVLVSAAAGSGKTAVLSQRVIERLTDPVNPTDADRLLVVTYTRAAAAEMKERISAQLSQLIKNDPLNSRLHRQQLLLSKANISTIHSFCNEIVKENFFQFDISPNFKVADDTELALLKNDALNSVLDVLYEEAGSQFATFTNAFSNAKSDLSIHFAVLKLYEFLCSHPFAEKWLNEKEQMYDFETSASNTAWGRVIINYCADGFDFCRSLSAQSLNCLGELPEASDKLSSLINRDNLYLDELINTIKENSWDKIGAKLSLFDFKERFPSLKGLTDNPAKLKIQANRSTIKDTIKDMKKLFACSEAVCREQIFALSPIVHQLFKTLRLFALEYSRLKKERNFIDFSDLEHLTLAVLVKETSNGFEFTKEAAEIAQRFDEVMVDEYQDANEVQDLIFQAVSGQGEKLFVVGDVKQSIYRFRQAKPEIFIRRKERYPIYDSKKENYPCKIILDKNFRSRNGVTDAVNFVFKRLMSKEVGDMDYTDEEILTSGATYPDSSTQDTHFHLLELGEDDDSRMDILEARHIAKIIKQTVGTYMVTEGDTSRAAKYADVAILLRNSGSHASVFVKELERLGIPANSSSSDNFLSAHEVAVMISLLKIIDNPIQDIPLLTVLMSPIYGFTSDEMAKIRVNSPKDSLYSALKTQAESNAKVKLFLEEINLFRSFAASNPTDKLIHMIYSLTSYTEFAAVNSTSEPETALQNLQLLQEYAKNYELSGYKGLCGFIRFINRLEEHGRDLPAAQKTGAEANSVSVMSIHGSKGLEFPVCFIATLSRQFNNDKRDDILLHSELGLGIKHTSIQTLTRINTMPRSAVDLELERESKSEELRVLYVAMTRAREKLYMISSRKSCEKYIKDIGSQLSNANKISPYVVRSAGSMSNWVTACAMLHPSGEELRKIAGLDIIPACDNNSLWDIQVLPYKPREETKEALTKTTESIASETSTIDINILKKRFEAIYKYKDTENIPVKVSVSEIAHDSNVDLTILSHPAFLLNKDLTPAQKGTALHSFMQYADYKLASINLTAERARLVKSGFLSQQEADVLNLSKITACLNSNVMQRFLHSQKQYREYRFTVKTTADILGEAVPNKAHSEEIVMQGAVDCAFEEDGELVIVDYKTDKIKDISVLTERYKKQLELYRTAMQQTTGLHVKQCILYSLTLAQSIEIL
ncbi:ATP-dependent helicase/nuclease subunit A [Clostridia bacterium]|nr:ATP-dependent helicase/nuclease subunit A [Clostridia bacterium]